MLHSPIRERPVNMNTMCRDAADSGQGNEDGDVDGAKDAAKRVKDEAEAALRRRQQARMEVCPCHMQALCFTHLVHGCV